MKKFLLLFLFWFLIPFPSFAATTSIDSQVNLNSQSYSITQKVVIPSSGYIVEDFKSEISVQMDSTLFVTETITTFFYSPKHGIIRIIPYIYSGNGRNIRADLQILSVTDENGDWYKYEMTPFNQSMRLQIGDSTTTISGRHVYVIKYQIGRVILESKDYDEVYWNVTGHEWDTTIKQASAVVNSPYAKITKIDCWSGPAGANDKFCQQASTDKQANFKTTGSLENGSDFTIDVGLDKKNELVFPSFIERIKYFLTDNLDYWVALMPLLLVFLIWFWKGRDKRYLSPEIYYKPDDQKTQTVPLFPREHIPLVYSPIDNLSPSQVGTIIDERIDIQDVVAEILELGRLGYLEIHKVGKDDYLFVDKKKGPASLKDYQKYLYESIFDIQLVNKDLKSSFDDIEDEETQSTLKSSLDDITKQKLKKFPDAVLLSNLKEHFYDHLEEFKNKLYDDLTKENIFVHNPKTVKAIAMILAVILIFFSFTFVLIVSTMVGNPFSFTLFLLTIIPIFILAMSMPRRTAWGYSLYRQINGLKFYINEGKWREEIAEKNLFLEEILPLAVCLGVVSKLTKDMADLGIQPPQYFQGIQTAAFYSGFNSFQSSTSTSLISTPAGSSWSGKSSWSGGSGFSGGGFGGGGGFSGGGFGGGGGGSW